MSSVTVLTPHGRRETIPVLPHMTLLQLLEEVCNKYSDFKSEEFCLKHHNKELDLSQMFRFSGLPNKCLLEMDKCKKQREETVVDICLQLESGSRCEGKFYPNQTLSNVLTKLIPNSLKQNLVIVYMRTYVYGDALDSTTLKSLGITKGRSMFRVLNKTPEELRSQANFYVQNTQSKLNSPLQNNDKQNSNATDNVQSSVPKGNENILDNTKHVEHETMETDKVDVNASKKICFDWESFVGKSMHRNVSNLNASETEKPTEEPEIFELGGRNAVVFSLNSAQKNVDNISESFFDLTVEDLKILLRDLHKEFSGNENAPLLTTKLRQLEESDRALKKLDKYKNCVIRIQFPDRMVLQGTFSPVEKVESIYEFVKSYLENPNLEFFLFTTPPKKVLEREKTLFEANCIPTAVLHFGVNDFIAENYYLKQSLRHTSATGAMLAASKLRGLMVTQQYEQESSKNDVPGPSGQKIPFISTGAVPKQPKSQNFLKKSSNSNDSLKKAPKWFKPNKN